MSGSEVDGGTELVSGGGIPGDAEPDESTAATVTEPAKVMRIGSMVKQLLEEVREAPLDEASREAAGRVMIAAIGRTTARHLEEVGLPATAIASRPEAGAMVAALVEASRDRA